MLKFEGTDKIRDIKYEDGYVDKIYYDNNTQLVFTSDKEKTGVDEVKFKGRKLVDVTSYGKCIQTNLPLGYTQLEYIESSGTQYINTGIVPTVAKETEIRLTFARASSTTPEGFGTNTNLNIVNTTTNWRLNGENTTVPIVDNEFVEVVLKQTSNGRYYKIKTTEGYGSANAQESNFYLGKLSSGSCSFNGKYKASTILENGTIVQNLIPTRRNSDNVLGMYDTITGNFFTNAGTGDFIAGPDAVPTPDTPIDIVCNNGVLKARHQSGLPLGYTLLDYIESTGTQYIISPIKSVQNSTFYLDFQMVETPSRFTTIWGAMPTSSFYKVVFGSGNEKLYSQPGNASGFVNTINKDLNRHQATLMLTTTSETVVFDDETYSNNFVITADSEMPLTFFARYRYDGMNNFAKVRLYSAWHKNSDNELDFSVVPCKNPSNVLGLYDLVNNQFYDNDGTGDFIAGNEISDPVEIYADGTVETIKDSLNNTATAEMLLKVGNYKDIQEVIAGSVTRNIGIKIFDGTETFTVSSSGAMITTISDVKIGAENAPINTHFALETSPTSIAVGTQRFGSSGTQIYSVNYYMKPLTNMTASDFKQFLADQYNAGTPVIVIYPLETPTMEQVLGQQLTIQQGNNTVEVTQASVDDILLKVKYK